MICIHDHEGNLLLGKAPSPEFSLSGAFLQAALTMGYPKGKK